MSARNAAQRLVAARTKCPHVMLLKIPTFLDAWHLEGRTFLTAQVKLHLKLYSILIVKNACMLCHRCTTRSFIRLGLYLYMHRSWNYLNISDLIPTTPFQCNSELSVKNLYCENELYGRWHDRWACCLEAACTGGSEKALCQTHAPLCSPQLTFWRRIFF